MQTLLSRESFHIVGIVELAGKVICELGRAGSLREHPQLRAGDYEWWVIPDKVILCSRDNSGPALLLRSQHLTLPTLP